MGAPFILDDTNQYTTQQGANSLHSPWHWLGIVRQIKHTSSCKCLTQCELAMPFRGFWDSRNIFKINVHICIHISRKTGPTFGCDLPQQIDRLVWVEYHIAGRVPFSRSIGWFRVSLYHCRPDGQYVPSGCGFTHCGLMTHPCVNQLGHHWFWLCFDTCFLFIVMPLLEPILTCCQMDYI